MSKRPDWLPAGYENLEQLLDKIEAEGDSSYFWMCYTDLHVWKNAPFYRALINWRNAESDFNNLFEDVVAEHFEEEDDDDSSIS